MMKIQKLLEILILTFISLTFVKSFRLSQWGVEVFDPSKKDTNPVYFEDGSLEFQYTSGWEKARVTLQFFIFDRESFQETNRKFFELDSICRGELSSTYLKIHLYGNEIISMVKKEKQDNQIFYQLKVMGVEYRDNQKTYDINFIVTENVQVFEEIMDDILNHKNSQNLAFLK